MDEKAVRAVGAGWVLLLAAAVAGWGSFVVGRWNDVFGATNARWAGPGTLLWGALLALLCALVASGASALTHTARWVTRLGTAVVVLAFLGPMASTQAHIEWRRAQPSAEEQEALLEQEMHELQEKHAEVGPTAPPLGTGIATARTRLAAAGWVVDPGADPAVVGAARDGYTVAIDTDRREPLPDEALRGEEGFLEPTGTVSTVTGPDDEIDEPNGAKS